MNERIRDRQLVERLSQIGGVEPNFMREFIKEVMATIEEGLLRDGVVRIHNFGTFRLRWSEARAGINPRTGEKMMIPARGRVVFQPAKNLRELVNLFHHPSLPAPTLLDQPQWESETDTETPFQAPITVPASPSSAPVVEEPVEEFEIAEVLPNKANATTPTFVFDESAEKTKPESSQTEPELDRLLLAPPRRRSRRFAWFAGAATLFLLLLLFVFVDRISEKLERASPPVASTTQSPTPAQKPAPESPSPTNGLSAAANGHNKATNGLTKSSTESTPFFAGGTHEVLAGDNLWNLSGAYYRDHYLWPNIYRVNSTAISNPDILQIEQQLVLPVLIGPPERLTPTDRRNLAEGYFLLYRYYKENVPHLAPYALWAAVQYDSAIKTLYATELREDDLAFLQAHGVRRVLAERE